MLRGAVNNVEDRGSSQLDASVITAAVLMVGTNDDSNILGRRFGN